MNRMASANASIPALWDAKRHTRPWACISQIRLRGMRMTLRPQPTRGGGLMRMTRFNSDEGRFGCEANARNECPDHDAKVAEQPRNSQYSALPIRAAKLRYRAVRELAAGETW